MLSRATHPARRLGHPLQTLAILIPLIVVLSTLVVLILLLAILLLRRKRGIELSDEGGPTNLEREDEVEGEGGLDGVESRWLQTVDEPTKMGYVRAKSASLPSLAPLRTRASVP